MCLAHWLLANRHALRTILGLTGFIRTLDFTDRFFAFDFTNCIFGFLTHRVAYWGFTDRFTNCLNLFIKPN